MGRVYAPVRANGRELWTLFDTGARNTYLARDAAAGVPLQGVAALEPVGLGGERRTLRGVCVLNAVVEGKPVCVKAFILDEIGRDEQGRAIEMLFGALEMQNWGITPVPKEERLDLSHYPTEFIEYLGRG